MRTSSNAQSQNKKKKMFSKFDNDSDDYNEDSDEQSKYSSYQKPNFLS